MDLMFKKIKNFYLKIFVLEPKIISTIFFIPYLYIIGWILAQPIFIFGLDYNNVSLIGTIITFVFFVISLPKWFQLRWGLVNTWSLVGINKIYKNKKLGFYFLKGILYSIALMLVILIPIFSNNFGNWKGTTSFDILVNSIFLIIGIGFAEELIFRGWLLEELKYQFGLKRALILQASIFSLVHIGFDMPFWEMISILLGLFLLGILLALLRLINKNSLWVSIGLHGGLVGEWFLINNGLIEISKDAPLWLVGPGGSNTNPLGGLIAIFLLLGLCFFYWMKLRLIQTVK